MTATHQPHWISAYESVGRTLQMALGHVEQQGQREERFLDEASVRGAVSTALADASDQRNARHLDVLLSLPSELVRAIFRLLAFRDRVTASHVSRGWRATALADPFLWNAARFRVDRTRGSSKPAIGRRRADMLRALLARSDPVPFALAWENHQPDEMVDLMLQSMHRMLELTADLSAHAFACLFALPAPELRSFCCTAGSEPCALPAQWHAPLLRTLELGIVHVPADAQPFPRVDAFKCYALYGLRRPLSQLFPALTSLCIEAATPDVAHGLRELPERLAELTLWTGDAPAIDYAPLLAAWRGHRFALLRLESARDAAPVLELFASAVSGAWAMTVARRGWRLVLAAERENTTYDIDLAAPLSFAREPRMAQHLSQMSALSADASLLVQMQMAAAAPTLPALRRLALQVTSRPEWPSGPCVPIPVPQLEDVSMSLDAEADGAALWVTEQFPEMVRSRLAYDRPMLGSITIKADPYTAKTLDEPHLAALRELSDCICVDVLRDLGVSNRERRAGRAIW